MASLISAPGRAFQPLDLVQWKVGEKSQETADVGVLRVPPELPIVVGAEQVLVEPHRTLRRLAHLRAVGGGDQRAGDAEELGAIDPPGQLDPVDDVAPLVGSADLQPAADPPRQLQKVVRLEDHVVELEEGQRLFAVEPQPNAVEGQHAIDREMPSELAQERNVVSFVKPIRIVHHDRVGWSVAECQEALEHLADAGDVARRSAPR